MSLNKNGWNGFLKLCASASKKKMLDELFGLFLTAEERESVATRCLIVRELLAEKKPQRQISKDLQVSIAKITRGSNEIKEIAPAFKKFLKEKI